MHYSFAFLTTDYLILETIEKQIKHVHLIMTNSNATFDKSKFF